MNVLDEILRRESAPHRLPLQIHGLGMVLHSNDVAVLDAMREVYGRYVAEPAAAPQYEIWALDLDPARYMPAERSAFEPYVVASGKAKDPFFDDGEVRYVVKKTTGLCVIFDARRYVVFGNMDEAVNQLNNIVNAVHMQEMTERGYVIVHGAGLELGGVGFALAGRAGTGKTTTLLKIVAAGGVFVSNDRLIVRRDPAGGGFEMLGVVKWPRVCAGTMHGDPTLRAQLPAAAAERYARMSFDELFGLEEKYDVNVDATYGPGHVKDHTRFRRMYLLEWTRGGEGLAIARVDTGDESFWDGFGPNLSRDAGVFDRRQRSSSWTPERKARYREGLAGLEVFSVTGKLDFDRAADALREHLRESG
jgi:HprK-related kinase B